MGYHAGSRELQDRFGTRALADRLDAVKLHVAFTDADRAFIEARDMFFLATADAEGRPTCSYKGGDPGFVRVLDERTIAWPNYDGNGMYLSLGNIASSPNVGLLFIDFESPRRLRVQGTARVVPSEDALTDYPGAQYLVRITASQVFVNCGRYIHKVKDRTLSPHVPDKSGRQPFPEWNRIDLLAETLPERDQSKVAQAGGPIPVEAYRGEESPGTDTTV